jgi:hypothetical protein
MSTKITINGREYDSPEQMPPDVRKIYDGALAMGAPLLEDRDGNGVPDLLEGKAGFKLAARVAKALLVNGVKYNSPDEMPPDVRQLYEQTMAKAKAGGSGVKIDTVRFAPTFTFRIGGPRPAAEAGPVGSDGGAPPKPTTPGTPRPIEPSNIEAGIRNFVVTVLLLVSLSVAWWWWRMGSH